MQILKPRRAWLALILVAAFSYEARGQEQKQEQKEDMSQMDHSKMNHSGMSGPDGMPGMKHGMGMNQAGMYLMNLASGTSMNPRSWPMPMLMPRVGSWNL